MRRKRCGIIVIIACLIIGSIPGCGVKADENSQLSRAEQTGETDQSKKVQIADVKSEETQPTTVSADYSEEFEYVKGCAVLLDPGNNIYTFYNEDKCRTRVSPDSTFKIISALIGIHNRVVTSEDSKMGYSGVSYPVDAWNADLRLEDAFQSSCIWYFRKILDEVGKDTVQEELNKLSYGNCDISQWNGSGVNPLPELNGFWIESSLQISPLEQTEILRSIIEGHSIYTGSEIEILKNIMLLETDGSTKIYGKTGTGTDGTAWFVGFAEKEKSDIYFAVYLDDASSDVINGNKAQEIAFNVLRKNGLL